MAAASKYIDLKGLAHSLTDLDPDERRLIAQLRKQAVQNPDWNTFTNSWFNTVAKFYDARGLSRKESRRTVVYQIAQDLGNRLAIAAGLARQHDYRSQLLEIIRTQFQTNHAFCEATGLSEDMLSHVLAGRKDLSMQALSQALERIGYEVRLLARQKIAG
ncbi:MAG TPA: hypothetical protein VE988_14120 [Gemmataceae bacterium]|nr:hypothetical protein [Gemmataceae bacterium]